MRDAAGSGEVVAVGYGGDEVPKVLRNALAMGVDRGLHVKGITTFDALATARALANAVKGQSFDLILCGKSAIDHDNHGVGVMVAELLDLPSVSVVVKIEQKDGKLLCEREVEGGLVVVETPMPCVVCAQKGLNEPRYASLKGIMAAKKKPIDEVEGSAGDSQVEVIEIQPKPQRQPGQILGQGVDAIPALIQKLREEAKVL
jgi:electron transfer flavoprotein beta subunit